MRIKAGLEWKPLAEFSGCEEAILGDFEGSDGVRFSISHYPTCYRRGPWRLLVEVCGGINHELWGCFDEQDQPMRWYHSHDVAYSEAQAIADVLAKDRALKGPARTSVGK